MPSVAYPVAYAALLDAVSILPDLRSTDGWDTSNDPSDVLQVGVPSLSDESAISAGMFEQEQQGHGAAGIIRETGTINAVLAAWNGSSTAEGVLAARAAAFTHLDNLSAAIRADRHLGVTAFDLTFGVAFATGDIAEDKVDGATCAVSFTVNYTALMGA